MIEKPATRIPLHTPSDMLAKLKWEESRLVESWSLYDSFNFIVTAHHLYRDWLRDGTNGTPEQRARRKRLPDNAKAVFDAVIDVSNGCKHWRMTDQKRLDQQVIKSVSEPCIASYDAYFASPMVYFEFDSYYVSMSEISALVVGYLEWVVNGGDDAILAELSNALEGMRVSDPQSSLD